MLIEANSGETNELVTNLFNGGAQRPAPQAAGSEGAARPRHTPLYGRLMQAPFSNEGRYTK